jgi:uncharacterized tellurite resistance protein B-like protein
MWFVYTIVLMIGLGMGNFPLAIVLLFFIMFMRNRWNSVIDYDLYRSRIDLEREYARQQAKKGPGRATGSRTYIPGGTNYFYNMNKLSEDDYRFEYFKHLIRVASAIISIDKKYNEKEINTLINFIGRIGFTPDNLKRLKDEMDRAIYEEIFIPGECEFIRQFMRREDRLEFIRLLFLIATADRMLSKEEENLIEEVAFDLYLPDEDYKRVRAEFRPKFDSFYEILGVPESANFKEIKQAYKELVKKNHPDKFAHLGQKVTFHANERLKKINAAYSTIRKQRGFN